MSHVVVSDKPVTRQPIDFTGWELIFTARGKYYFFDTVEGRSFWNPPENLLSYLLELPPGKLDELFNPFVDYVPLEYEEVDLDGKMGEQDEGGMSNVMVESDEEYAVPDEEDVDKDVSLEAEFEVKPSIKRDPEETKRNQEERERCKMSFETMLRERTDIDPFQSWLNISKTLAEDPRFQAVKNEKERKIIFDGLCPDLVRQAKAKRQATQAEAIDSWRRCLGELSLATAPGTWTEFNRRVKKHPWFKILDQNRMEKEYRSRIADLRERSTVYQIPK